MPTSATGQTNPKRRDVIEVAGVRIDSQPVSTAVGWLSVVNPATGLIESRVAMGGSADAVAAADAAGRSLPEWSGVAAADREAALRNIARRIRDSAAVLADLVTRETGKRYAESVAEANFAADYFDFYAGLTETPRTTFNIRPGLRHDVSAAPVGVVAVVTPWNFPLSIPARKIAPALAAGGAVVVKPSDLSPRSWLMLADIIDDVVPPGVLNTVCGDGQAVVDALLAHDHVRAVHFTGSVAVGQAIAETAGRELKGATLELGGRAPFVVLDDADLSVALDAAMVAKFRNNGASCIAANNIWVHARHYADFTEQLAGRVSTMEIGDPLDPETDLGPIRTGVDRERILDLVDELRHCSGHVVGGRSTTSEGFFVEPAVCTDVGDCGAWRTELFGPVVLIRRFEDIEDVVGDVNSGSLGLAAYVCSTDPDRANALAARLDVGVVGVNTGTPNTPEVPFGGRRDSGIGYEGGRIGLDPFLAYKSVASRVEVSRQIGTVE